MLAFALNLLYPLQKIRQNLNIEGESSQETAL